MTPERAQAYRRVIRTLEQLGPSKLLEDEKARIREAADSLIFSSGPLEDAAAFGALWDIEVLSRQLVDSGRWERVTAKRLAEDVAACGLPHSLELRAA
jgi:hypothetical protein